MVVQAKNITKYFLKTKVLNSVNIEIQEGERVAMMGPNGAGKTTFVRALLGFYHIDSGQIKVKGLDPIKERVDVLRHISFIPQLPPPIRLRVDELVNYVSKSQNIPKMNIYQESQRMELDLKDHESKPFFKLSGGMKQKLLIAIALSRRSDLLIFDEPTANLDPKGRENFYHLLDELDESISTIFITHRIDEIISLVNRKIYMDLGRVVEDEKI
jgi:ABC-2 type transport system ATP-binding protein